MLKDTVIPKMLFLTIGLSSLGLFVMIQAGWATYHIKPIILGGLVIGGVIFGASMAIFGKPFVGFFLKLFSTPEGVLKVAEQYLEPIFLLLPFAFVTNSINATFNGLGKTKVILYATLFTTFANIGLAVLLIYGKLGFPRFGVEGAGWAVALAESFALLVYIPFLISEKRVSPLRGVKLSPEGALEILKIGLPTGVERLVMSFSYNVFVGLVALCGATVLAAFQIGLRIEAVSFTVGMAFSFAATTVAGQNFGAKNPYGVKEGTKITLKVAIGVMSLSGVLIAIFSKHLAEIFTKDPEVVYWTVHYLWIIAISQPLMAVIFVLAGSIRGMGKTKIPLVVNISNFWFVRILPSMFLLKVFKTPYVPWGAMIAENVTRSLTYLILYRRLLP